MTNAGELFIDEVVRDEIEMDEHSKPVIDQLRDAGYYLYVEEHPDSPAFSGRTHDIDFPERGRVRLYVEATQAEQLVCVAEATFSVEHRIERGWENYVVAYIDGLLVLWKHDVIDDLCVDQS